MQAYTESPLNKRNIVEFTWSHIYTFLKPVHQESSPSSSKTCNLPLTVVLIDWYSKGLTKSLQEIVLYFSLIM